MMDNQDNDGMEKPPKFSMRISSEEIARIRERVTARKARHPRKPNNGRTGKPMGIPKGSKHPQRYRRSHASTPYFLMLAEERRLRNIALNEKRMRIRYSDMLVGATIRMSLCDDGGDNILVPANTVITDETLASLKVEQIARLEVSPALMALVEERLSRYWRTRRMLLSAKITEANVWLY